MPGGASKNLASPLRGAMCIRSFARCGFTVFIEIEYQWLRMAKGVDESYVAAQ